MKLIQIVKTTHNHKALAPALHTDEIKRSINWMKASLSLVFFNQTKTAEDVHCYMYVTDKGDFECVERLAWVVFLQTYEIYRYTSIQ